MKTRRSNWQGFLLSAVLLLTTNGGLQAATINVPGGGDIQAAIDSAAPGDTILVAPGIFTVAMSLNINKANLIVQSTGGAGVTRIELNDATMPVVKITAPGCTLNGFWIRQLDDGVQAGHSGGCVRIEPDGVSPTQFTPGTPRPITTVQNCVISGDETGEGIVTYSAGSSALSYVHLRILNNQFVQHGAGMFSFQDAIHLHFSDLYGSGDNISAGDCLIEIFGNSTQAVDRSSVYVHGQLWSSKMDMGNNQFNQPGSDYGIYFSDSINVASSVNIVETTIDGASYPVYTGNYVYNLSSVKIMDCTFTDFDSNGVYIYAYYGCSIVIDPTTMTGNGMAMYGIYAGAEYDSELTIDQVTISGLADGGYGIYSYAYYNSRQWITNNNLDGEDVADYGIYTDTGGYSTAVVNDNRVAGFDRYGITEDDLGPSVTMQVLRNTVEGPAGGMYCGIYMYGPYDRSTLEAAGNVVTNYDSYGYYGEYVEGNSSCVVRDNRFHGLSGSGNAYGIYQSEVYDNSRMTIESNLVTGFDYFGVYVYYVYYISSVLVQNNTVAGASTGSDYGIGVDDVYYYADVTFANNVVSNVSYNAFYIDECYYFAILNVVNNTMTSIETGMDYGVYCYGFYNGAVGTFSGNDVRGYTVYGHYNEYIEEGSVQSVDNSNYQAHVDGAMFGFFQSRYPEYGSLTNIRNTTFRGYGNMGGGEYGVYFDNYFNEGANLVMQDNILEGHEMGAEGGLYVDGLYEGCTHIITGNTITNYTYAGIWYDTNDFAYGCIVQVLNNVLNALPGGSDYGMSFDDEIYEGCVLDIIGNEVTRFTDTGIYLYYLYYGEKVRVNNNRLIGEADGAYYGVYVDNEVDYGSLMEVNQNYIANIKDGSALYFNDYIEYGSKVWINDNVLRGFGDPANYGITIYYGVYGGATLEIARNDIDGFTTSSIWFDYPIEQGAVVDIFDNQLMNGEFGIDMNGYEIQYGAAMNILRNRIIGFTEYGLHLYDVFGGWLNINGNQIVGGGTVAAIELNDVYGASRVGIEDNCIDDVPQGVIVNSVLDSSQVTMRNNDFSGVTGISVTNTAGAATNPVDARENFFGDPNPAPTAVAAGEVLITPQLAAAPDSDGDGVPNCADACPGTPAGAEVDASGCPTGGGGPPPPPPPPPCGICGIGVGGMMPLWVVGLIVLRRSNARRRACR